MKPASRRLFGSSLDVDPNLERRVAARREHAERVVAGLRERVREVVAAGQAPVGRATRTRGQALGGPVRIGNRQDDLVGDDGLTELVLELDPRVALEAV